MPLFQLSLIASSFSWGEVVKTDISKDEVKNIIQEYVDERYPNKVSAYYNKLDEKKAAELNKIQNVVFVNNNLMWQDEAVNQEKKLNQLEFKFYCKNLELAQRRDWRTPTYDELLTLVNYERIDPAVNEQIKNIKPSKYWTSSKSIHETNKNWFIDFAYGTTNISSDLERYNIRCVRRMANKRGTY